MDLVHNKTAKQYEYHERDIKGISPNAYVRYEKDTRNFYITNVYVPSRFKGKNIDDKMLAEVIANAGLEGMSVVPKCQEAISYMDKKGFNY